VEELRRPLVPIATQGSSGATQGGSNKEQQAMAQDAKSEEFDVFLCHNSQDKPQVKEIARQLQARGLKPWLDESQLPPGLPWQRALEEQIEQIKSAAVFVGKNGRGPWQNMELEAFLREFVSRKCPVIPVVLADAPDKPELPIFLRGMTWVDFRKKEPDPIKQLIWGITSKKPIVSLRSKSGNKQVTSQPSIPESSSSFEQFDVFISYSDRDAAWVEKMAARLEDEAHLHVWLDKWVLIPGESAQQAVARGLDQAKACAVFIGANTPLGWAREEIERALNRQAKEASFRVIPVLLPNASTVNVDSFLELRTKVDFRNIDPAYAFHLLVCGVKGVSPGRWPH
jgi:hypothetical protein